MIKWKEQKSTIEKSFLIFQCIEIFRRNTDF
jgi:hypothetical protein